MDIQLFKIESYLRPSEAFHVARKELEGRAPKFAHRHDYFEVFLVEHGSARHWINGQIETLKEGAFVFIRPDDAHAFRASRRSGCRIINVMFRPSTADYLISRYRDEFAGRFFWKDGPRPDAYYLQGPRMERAVNTALELQTSRRNLALIEAYLLTIMTRVVDHTVVSSDLMPAWLVAACQAAHHPDIFRKGAAGFVEAAGRGHEHVCRRAKQYLGLTPSAYINRVRMEHAAMVLGSSDKAISEIALECGVENLSHFYRLFREHYGATPKAYRNRHHKDPMQPRI